LPKHITLLITLFQALNTIKTGVTLKLIEVQALVKPEYADLYKDLAIDSFRKSGEYFNLKCPMTGDARVGQNWEQTH
jgi:hypothetical protein